MLTTRDDVTLTLQRGEIVDLEYPADAAPPGKTRSSMVESSGGGRVILYDTGDLVDDYVVDPHLRTTSPRCSWSRWGLAGRRRSRFFPCKSRISK